MAEQGQVESDRSTYQTFSKIFTGRTAQNCATHLLLHICPHHLILDVGCGTGSITLDLARCVPEGHVVGVDVNEDWLAQAKDLAKQRGITNVEFRTGDVTDLKDFEPNSFDVVHAHQLVCHVPDKLAALKEMRRVAKPNGIISSRDVHHTTLIPADPVLVRMSDKYSDFVRGRGADLTFGASNHVKAHEAGFAWDKIETSSWAWEVSGREGRQAWAAAAKGTYATFRADELKAGVVTDEELEVAKQHWDAWAENLEARFVAVDGAVLCWK